MENLNSTHTSKVKTAFDLVPGDLFKLPGEPLFRIFRIGIRFFEEHEGVYWTKYQVIYDHGRSMILYPQTQVIIQRN